VDRPMELFPWTTLDGDPSPLSSSSSFFSSGPKHTSLPHCSSSSSSSPSSLSTPCCTHLCYHCSTIFSSHKHPNEIHVCSSCRDTFLVPLSPREERKTYTPEVYPSDTNQNYFMIKKEDLSLSMERELKISDDLDNGKQVPDPKLILSPSKKTQEKSKYRGKSKRLRRKKKPASITTTLPSSMSMPTLKIGGRTTGKKNVNRTKKDRTIFTENEDDDEEQKK